MSETVITSVAEFHEQLRKLATGAAVFLYRGQAEAAWPVSCSAARRLTKDPSDPLEIQNVSFRTLIGYLEFLIARAKMRGFLPPEIDITSPDLELLAQLQHQGAATGLIDFTRQPHVALWFACNEARADDGAISVLARSATEEISSRRDIENRTIQSFYQGDTLWSWEPAALGNRIVAQSSVFVLGVPAVASDMMGKFIVRAGSKNEILGQLESVYGISEEMLFSDFPGFAVANAANKSFDINDSMTFWLEQIARSVDDAAKVTAHRACGLAYADIRDDEKAKVQYVAAQRIAERMQGLSD